MSELEDALAKVAYIDEYPEIAERLRLRRLAAARPLGNAAVFVLPIDYRQIMEEPPQ